MLFWDWKTRFNWPNDQLQRGIKGNKYKIIFLATLWGCQKTLIKHKYWVWIDKKVIFRYEDFKRSAVQIF